MYLFCLFCIFCIFWTALNLQTLFPGSLETSLREPAFASIAEVRPFDYAQGAHHGNASRPYNRA